jgi:hypothetical protein
VALHFYRQLFDGDVGNFRPLIWLIGCPRRPVDGGRSAYWGQNTQGTSPRPTSGCWWDGESIERAHGSCWEGCDRPKLLKKRSLLNPDPMLTEKTQIQYIVQHNPAREVITYRCLVLVPQSFWLFLTEELLSQDKWECSDVGIMPGVVVIS